jgi:hypothetical protein
MLFAKGKILVECDTVSGERLLMLFRITKPSSSGPSSPRTAMLEK